MNPPEQHAVEERLRAQIEAYHTAGLAYAAVKLGLPETMGSDVWTAERLAASLDVSASHLFRVLRGLATLGLVEAHSDDTFALTAAGKSLAPGAPTNLREKLLIVVEQYWQPWANVAACLKTGTPAFELVFGETVGDWRRSHPAHGAAFDSYLARESFANAGSIIEALDLTRAKTVADIGGGHGGLLAAILQTHPKLCGVLFDQPHMAEAAKAFLQPLGVAERVAFVTGDFLTGIPVQADVYLLKSVLQQWDDTEALRILKNCRDAMKPGAQLIIYERLMPEKATDDSAAIMLDLHMMVISGGQARTRAEMEALLTNAGFSVTNVSVTCEGLSFIECTP